MPLRRAVAVLSGLWFVYGCGGGSSVYERQASALCRDFNEAAFAGHVDAAQAQTLYARLADGLARLTAPEEFRRTHGVLLGFARAGEATFAGVNDRDAPKVDLRLVVGDWIEDVPRVRRDLPDCADSLTGTDRDPDVVVIP